MRPITFVCGDVDLICAAKLASSSNVFTTARPRVLRSAKICGSLREIKIPNLLGGPAGKGVAMGVGVGGMGVWVGVALGGVGAIVGSIVGGALSTETWGI